MTDATLYISAGSVVGAGALGGALWLRAKWDAYIEHMVAARCADRMATEEMSIGRLALKTQQALKPDLESLELRTENKIKTFILESESRVTRTVIATAAKHLSQDRTEVIKTMTEQLADAGVKLDPPKPPPAEKPFDWRADPELKALAAMLHDSLVKMKMPDAQAQAQVIGCMNRCAKCGMKNDKATHDKLFGECFKKVS